MTLWRFGGGLRKDEGGREGERTRRLRYQIWLDGHSYHDKLLGSDKMARRQQSLWRDDEVHVFIGRCMYECLYVHVHVLSTGLCTYMYM